MRSLFCVLLCLAATGCRFFEQTNPRAPYVSPARWQSIRATNRFICLYDEKNTKAEELATVRLLAAELGLTAEFRNVSGSRIPALLRSGRGDLAAGGYTGESARERILGSVPYGGHVFLRRPDDTEWESVLNALHK